MTRLEANRLILKELSDYIENNPDIRFNQALFNNYIAYSTWEQGGELSYNEESEDTLKRMSK